MISMTDADYEALVGEAEARQRPKGGYLQRWTGELQGGRSAMIVQDGRIVAGGVVDVGYEAGGAVARITLLPADDMLMLYQLSQAERGGLLQLEAAPMEKRTNVRKRSKGTSV